MGARLKVEDKRKINGELYELCKVYYAAIPLKDINRIIRATVGGELLNEDSTPLSCLLCGDDSRAMFDIGKPGITYWNSKLYMSWYRMPSGKYEIVAYIS